MTNAEHEQTFLGALLARAQNHPEHRVYRFLDAEAEHTLDLSHRVLDSRARSIAARLQRAGAEGERVLILFAPGLDYLLAFLGCLYAGAVAVPAYPPRTATGLTRVGAIAADAGCKLVLASPELRERRERLCEQSPSLGAAEWLALAFDDAAAGDWREPHLSANSLAFLQYTSGSSASPKGVMVSHGNLVHNCQLVERRFGVPAAGPALIWLPPYHDMGLIGGLLVPLFCGLEQYVMTPAQFVRKPLLWLETISRFGIGCSGGPNFAYELCLAATEQGVPDLDLSSWRVAFLGAEPIRKRTLERFAARFAGVGFSQRAFFTCYGLAEATLLVSGGSIGAQPALELDGDAYRRGRAVTDGASASAISVVSCGPAAEAGAVAVVDPETSKLCAEGQLGEIWISSPSVALGYWGKPAESNATFRAQLVGSTRHYLRTGDIGFLHGGELYVRGRIKDVLIVRGIKHHAADIEATVLRSHPALAGVCSAAFSVDVDGEERVVVVSELRSAAHDAAELAEITAKRITVEHGLKPHRLEFVRVGSLPRTSSGKVQRFRVRESFLNGQLHATRGSAGVGREAAERAAAPPSSRSGP